MSETITKAELSAFILELSNLSDKPDDYEFYDGCGDPIDCDLSNSGDIRSHAIEQTRHEIAVKARTFAREHGLLTQSDLNATNTEQV